MRPKLAAALIVVGIAALPACSDASKVQMSNSATAQAAPKPRITMTPSIGHSSTRFVVGFTAPDRTGNVGGSVRRYQVSARTTAHHGHGCVSTAFASVSAPRNGARVSAKLVPEFGGSWCAGTFHGRIIETLLPPCPPLELCPAFISVIRTVGTFTFRVKADPGGAVSSPGSALSPSPCIPATYSARTPARPGATCG
jgi:hypothetical protein